MTTTSSSTITQLIFRESGGFAGLQRGYITAPQALPQLAFGQLQHLLQLPEPATISQPLSNLPDLQVYTLELVVEPALPTQTAQAQCEPYAPATTQTRHIVLQFPASDVPEDVSALIEFLREQATPLPLR
ncbi:MAG: hypothetical protein WB821_13375 [Burkholderiaceae bacterium]